MATCVWGWGRGYQAFVVWHAYFTSYIVFDRDGMNLESGVFFSDEDMTHSISDMMPSSGVSVPCEGGC